MNCRAQLDKTVVIHIHSEADLMQPSGNKIKKVDRVVYLGSILVSSASAEPELSRRLGEANGSFKTLDACWKHTNIKTERKIQIYLACVVSKLMYCLDSLWLLQGDIQRLDGFHAKCLKRILKIEPSYVSRVSNDFVLKSANQDQLSVLLKKRQNELFQKIASKDDNDLLGGILHGMGSLMQWQRWKAHYLRWFAKICSSDLPLLLPGPMPELLLGDVLVELACSSGLLLLSTLKNLQGLKMIAIDI